MKIRKKGLQIAALVIGAMLFGFLLFLLATGDIHFNNATQAASFFITLLSAFIATVLAVFYPKSGGWLFIAAALILGILLYIGYPNEFLEEIAGYLVYSVPMIIAGILWIRSGSPMLHVAGRRFRVICPRCGKEQVDNPAFCRNCGQNLRLVKEQKHDAVIEQPLIVAGSEDTQDLERKVMEYIRQHDYKISISQCAKELGCDDKTVSEILRYLDSKQVITAHRAPQNTSGQGPSAIVPSEISGWNWGAFFLGWIWGLGNRVYKSCIPFIPLAVSGVFFLFAIGHSSDYWAFPVFMSFLFLYPLAGLVMAFILGAKGNKWAWRNQEWDSVEHFRNTQQKWAYAGMGLFWLAVILGLIRVILI